MMTARGGKKKLNVRSEPRWTSGIFYIPQVKALVQEKSLLLHLNPTAGIKESSYAPDPLHLW